jgi:beta-N-acetylhexosaminidase
MPGSRRSPSGRLRVPTPVAAAVAVVALVAVIVAIRPGLIGLDRGDPTTAAPAAGPGPVPSDAGSSPPSDGSPSDAPSATGPSPADPSTPASSSSAAGSSSALPSPSPVHSVPAEPPPPAVPLCVSAALTRMPLAERAGQVLMIGVAATDPASAGPVVRRYRVGGVFLRGRTTASVTSLGSRLRGVQQIAREGNRPPVHVAVDQEGGLVQTAKGSGFGSIPTAVEQGTWSASTLRERALGWATALHRAGVTMNLAPVADTVTRADAASNPPIGAVHRNYGWTPSTVATDVVAVSRGFDDAGVLATLKHFPGLGRVRANTDTSTGAVDDRATTSDPNLQPFRAGIDAGAGAVMISSASYPGIDARRIAAFSPAIVTGLLRQQLGFDGLIVSDDLGSAVAVRSVSPGSRAVRFLSAGGDLVLSNRSQDAAVMRAALIAQAQSSSDFRQRLDDAATHVLQSKYREGMLTCR